MPVAWISAAATISSSSDSSVPGSRRSRAIWGACSIGATSTQTVSSSDVPACLSQKSFDVKGENGFRALETSALASLEAKRSLLVSCGGGIVETPDNIDLMRRMGYCVYLDGDLDDSLRQIRSLENRPDFRSTEHAAELFRHRRPLYEAAADLTLDIRGRTFKEVSYRCAEMLLERGLL